MAHRGRRRSQQASVESSDAPTYEENLVERLARSFERSGFTGVTVDQARRLGAVSFDGSTNPMVALSWLDDTEKILDEGMHCPNEDRVRIAGFLLGVVQGSGGRMRGLGDVSPGHSSRLLFTLRFASQPLLRLRG